MAASAISIPSPNWQHIPTYHRTWKPATRVKRFRYTGPAFNRSFEVPRSFPLCIYLFLSLATPPSPFRRRENTHTTTTAVCITTAPTSPPYQTLYVLFTNVYIPHSPHHSHSFSPTSTQPQPQISNRALQNPFLGYTTPNPFPTPSAVRVSSLSIGSTTRPWFLLKTIACLQPI
jgi:hypothetical protein